MRLKERPEDFIVRELLEFDEDRRGRHYVHLLKKQKIDTLEALKLVARRARVDRSKIAFAGLKDRQGVTEQWISIEGTRLDLKGSGVQCRFVGRSAEPVSSKMSQGNEFRITVRDVDKRDVDAVLGPAHGLREDGFANYFDDQRFGSVRHGQGFVMRDVLKGDFESALHALIARPSPRAITGDVKLKRLFAKHWGDWERLARIARGPVWQRLCQRLIQDPGDFRGALEALPLRQRLIHAFGYQSLLWNRAVHRLLGKLLPEYRKVRIDTVVGEFVSWSRLSEPLRAELDGFDTPLFGPEGDGGSEPFRRATDAVLAAAGLDRDAFAACDVPGMQFLEELRALRVVPRGARVNEPEPDEVFRGRRKIVLEFALPRGAYATMFIKHLEAAAGGKPARRRRES